MLRHRGLVPLVVVCVMAIGTPSTISAQEFLGLQIHGFGGWYYGRSSGPQFIGAEKGGNAQNAQLALNVSAAPIDRVRILSQVNFAERTDGSKVQLDYGFVEFDIGSVTKIRAGRVKHPWGIYGEIFDVGTARPFQHLSQAIYGPQGYTAKAYNGIGLTGTLASSSRWPLQYDLYGGEIDAEYEESGLFSLFDPRTPSTVPTLKYSLRSLNKDVGGARLQLNTPVDGLWVGASAYVSKVNLTGNQENHARAYLGSLEYQGARLLVRSEAGKIKLAHEVDQHSGYAEVAYKFTPKWQVAARYDELHRRLGTFAGVPLPPFVYYRFDVDHSERAFGLNYWLSPNIVVRGSYSNIRGAALLYPSPMELGTYIHTGVRPEDDVDVFLVGTQFSF